MKIHFFFFELFKYFFIILGQKYNFEVNKSCKNNPKIQLFQKNDNTAL